ncbi:MAG TPA: Npt1/Npt2 family nucleotide transporter, partial [Sandaracinaceae bacterium]
PRAVAIVLFLHTSIFGALVISGFWSVVNERFDPHTAKRVVSRIGVGATVGGVLGGVLTERVGAWGNVEMMLAALAGLNALAAAGVRGIGGPAGRAASGAPTDGWGVGVLRRAPYLRSLAALIVLTSASAGLLDYAFKAEAARTFEQGELLSFFALFHTAIGVLSLVVQSAVARPALARLGVAGAAATLPFVVFVTGGLASALPGLALIVVARAGELVLANSVFRSGYELLYTPVAPHEKRPTKALIDVAGNRLGDALGSALALLVLALAPLFAIPLVLALAAAMAGATLVLARRLHRGYLAALEGTLRSGAPQGAEIDLLRAATLQTLSTLGLDREALFEQLAAHQSWSEPSPAAEPPPRPLRGIEAPHDDPVHQTVAILRQGDPAPIRALLEGEIDLRLVPYVIALLARRDVYHEAIAALRRVAERAVAPLAKALTDPEQPFAIRRRIPRVLEVCESQEAADALIRGLDDEKFEVRYRAALALARIVARVPALRPPIERVHAAVRAELVTGRKVWDRRRLLDEDEEDAPLLDRALRDRIHRSVEHVFTLLSLAYD